MVCYITLNSCLFHLSDNLNYDTQVVDPLSFNPTKWPNTLKQFFGKLPTNYLSVFDHFVKLALKWLIRRDFSLFVGKVYFFTGIVTISSDNDNYLNSSKQFRGTFHVPK